MQMKKKYPLVVYFFLANTFFHRSRNKRYLLTRKAYRRFGRLHERGCTSHLIIAADFCRKFKRYGFEIHAALESTLPLNNAKNLLNVDTFNGRCKYCKIDPLAIQKQSKFATLRPIFVEYPLDA